MFQAYSRWYITYIGSCLWDTKGGMGGAQDKRENKRNKTKQARSICALPRMTVKLGSPPSRNKNDEKQNEIRSQSSVMVKWSLASQGSVAPCVCVCVLVHLHMHGALEGMRSNGGRGTNSSGPKSRKVGQEGGDGASSISFSFPLNTVQIPGAEAQPHH